MVCYFLFFIFLSKYSVTRQDVRLGINPTFNYNPRIVVVRNLELDAMLLFRSKPITNRRQTMVNVEDSSSLFSSQEIEQENEQEIGLYVDPNTCSYAAKRRPRYDPNSILRKTKNVPIGLLGRPRSVSTDARLQSASQPLSEGPSSHVSDNHILLENMGTVPVKELNLSQIFGVRMDFGLLPYN